MTTFPSFQGVSGTRNLVLTLVAGKIFEIIPKELLNLGGATDDTIQPVIELKITGYEQPSTVDYKQPIIRTLSTTSNSQSVLPLTGSASATTNAPSSAPTLSIQASTSSGEKIRLLYDPWSLSLIQNVGSCKAWNTGIQGAPWTSANWFERHRHPLVFEENGTFLYVATGSELDRLLQRMLKQATEEEFEPQSAFTPTIRIGVGNYSPNGGDIYTSDLTTDAIWDTSEFVKSYSVDITIDFEVPPTHFVGRQASFPSAGTGAWTQWEISGSRFLAGGGGLVDFIARMTSAGQSDKQLWVIESPYWKASPPTISISVEIGRRFYTTFEV